MSEPIEAELVRPNQDAPEQTALATTAEQPPAVHDEHAPITPAQARVDAVASLLHAAYERASTLHLTPEEGKALMAPFPDDAVRTGANGDQNLLYIEHGWIRDRLLEVFGPGQWSIINRRTWLDEGQGWMYAECVMVVRGCFVGEAIGAMRYTPRNARINYSDAVEGAESEALRRIAGKRLGVGLQVWKAEFCDGWKRMHAAKSKAAAQAPPTAPKPAPAPAPVKHAEPPKEATAKTREWFIKEIEAAGLTQQEAAEYYVKTGKLLDTEIMADLPLSDVPVTKQAAAEAIARIKAFVAGTPVDDSGSPVGPSNDDLRRDAILLTGYVKFISKKETKKAGHYRYGILITAGPDDKEGGTWVNTFSDTDAATAESLKGKAVLVWYNEGQYGNDLVERGIEANNDGVTP